ncbi:MAG: SHOCT domain-containing protein [Actinomycetota bacterium]
MARRTARRTTRRVAARQDPMAPQEPVASVAPTEAASSTDETADALKQLADLHAQGILTDEEFAAKKKQILGI